MLPFFSIESVRFSCFRYLTEVPSGQLLVHPPERSFDLCIRSKSLRAMYVESCRASVHCVAVKPRRSVQVGSTLPWVRRSYTSLSRSVASTSTLADMGRSSRQPKEFVRQYVKSSCTSIQFVAIKQRRLFQVSMACVPKFACGVSVPHPLPHVIVLLREQRHGADPCLPRVS